MKRSIFLLAFACIACTAPLHAQWQQAFNDAQEVVALAAHDSVIYAGTYSSGFFVSTNNGRDWEGRQEGLLNDTVLSIAASGPDLFIGTYSAGVFRSSNEGVQWAQVNDGLTNLRISALGVLNGVLFACSWGGGVFRSTNNGTAWSNASNGLPSRLYINSITTVGNSLYLGTNGNHVYRSDDNGDSWTFAGTGIGSIYVDEVVAVDTVLFAATFGKGVFRSTDRGGSWTAATDGITYPDVMSLATNGNTVYAGTLHGVFRSTDLGVSWLATGTSLFDAVFALTVTNTSVVAGTMTTGAWMLPLPKASVGPTGVTGGISARIEQGQLIVSRDNANPPGCNIELVDELGKKVLHEILTNTGETRVALPRLPSGVYFCRVGDGESQVILRCLMP